MEFKVDQTPAIIKWGMAAKGLTGALAAHMNAICNLVGEKI